MADSNKEIDVLLKAIFDSKGFDELQAAVGKTIEGQAKLKQSHEEGKKDALDFDAALGSIKDQALAMVGPLAAAALAATALKAAGDLFKSIIDEGVKAEAALFGLTNVLKVLANATDAEVETAKNFIDSLEITSGIADDRLIPALKKLAAATGDVSQAQNLLALAADAEKSGIGDLESSVQGLSKFILSDGGPIKGTDDFTRALAKAQRGGEDMATTLNRFAGEMHKTAESNDTVAQKLKASEIEFDNTKKAIGAAYTDLKLAMIPALKLLSAVLIGLAEIMVGVRLGLKTTGDEMVLLGRIAVDVAKGHFLDAIDTYKTGNAELQANLKKNTAAAGAEIEDLAKRSLQLIGEDMPEAAQAGAIKLVKSQAQIAKGMDEWATKVAASGKSVIEIDKALIGVYETKVKVLKKGSDEMLAAEKQLADARAKLASDGKSAAAASASATKQGFEDEVKWAKASLASDSEIAAKIVEIMKRRVAGTKAGTKEQKDAELSLAEAQKALIIARSAAVDAQQRKEKKDYEDKKRDDEKALADAKTLAEKRAKIDEIEQERRRTGITKTAKAELADLTAEKKNLEARLKAVGTEIDAEIKLREKLLAVEKKIGVAENKITNEAIALQKKKLAMFSQAAGAGIEIAKGAFGESKEIQIAEAIVNGISAAVEAYGNTGGGFTGIPAMLFSLATTGVQIATMEGTGFDDPDNDLMMKLTTKRWAQDMATKASEGWTEGLGESARGGSSITNNNTTQITNPGATNNNSTVNIYGAELIDTGNDTLLKKLSVKLDEMKTLNAEGIVK